MKIKVLSSLSEGNESVLRRSLT